MPIYRCNKCGFVAETAEVPVGSKICCGRCETSSTVYATAFFVEKLLEQYFAALREVATLKSIEKPEIKYSSTSASQPTAKKSELAAPLTPDLDLHNTTQFATPEQHQALKVWFEARQIEAQFDYARVDTSGFFDDAARSLGERYDLFSELLDRIRYAYRNSHSGLNLELGGLSQKDGQAINALCRQFYNHTLFSRYHYQKPEKIMRLSLQTAPSVREFFEGAWLEWFVLMELLNQLKEKNLAFSCARGVKVVFPNEDLHELDVLALPNGCSPICVECKTGEFRRDIDKYVRLKKRLGLSRNHFIICATSLTDEQAAGLSAMYELTFVNLTTLTEKLRELL